MAPSRSWALTKATPKQPRRIRTIGMKERASAGVANGKESNDHRVPGRLCSVPYRQVPTPSSILPHAAGTLGSSLEGPEQRTRCSGGCRSFWICQGGSESRGNVCLVSSVLPTAAYIPLSGRLLFSLVFLLTKALPLLSVRWYDDPVRIEHHPTLVLMNPRQEKNCSFHQQSTTADDTW